MSEESFDVQLADRHWVLPHLPFRVIKTIQPALFRAYADAAQAAHGGLDEAQIDNLATAAWRAIAFVDPELTLDAFVSLPFSVADLLSALPAVAKAAGLRAQSATSEASPEPGKSISTL